VFVNVQLEQAERYNIRTITIIIMAEDVKKEEKTEKKEKVSKETENLEVDKKTGIKEKTKIKEKKEEKAETSKDIKKKKKVRHQIFRGQAHIKCTYNNTMVTITDANGAVLEWASSGLLGFKGAKKATPYAATQVVNSVSEKVKKYDIKEMEVYIKGVGSGREASIRALANNGFDLILIKDITPIPHNGCRPRKPRRV
jgi:small subunit ribosomal protein S11